MYFVQLVILFFSLLILYSFIRVFTKPSIIEGATNKYQTYNNNNNNDNPLILANKNAANIEILKQKMDEISGISNQVKINKSDIDKNTKTIKSILSSMSRTSNTASKKNQALIDKNPDTFNT